MLTQPPQFTMPPDVQTDGGYSSLFAVTVSPQMKDTLSKLRRKYRYSIANLVREGINILFRDKSYQQIIDILAEEKKRSDGPFNAYIHMSVTPETRRKIYSLAESEKISASAIGRAGIRLFLEQVEGNNAVNG
jgi:hypothetical protein